METPNMFNFATSKLLQSTVWAYILDWANPAYRAEYPEMNKLGEDFLRTLVSAAKLEPVGRIEKLIVKTLDDRMGVGVTINDKVWFVVEDKIPTVSAWDNRRHPACSNPGANFSPSYWLKMLNNHPNIDDEIVNQFKDYLQHCKYKRKNFKKQKFPEWSWEAHEAYYHALAGKFREPVQWGYAENPAAGSLVFCWTPTSKKMWKNPDGGGTGHCDLYLQIDHRKGLCICAGAARNNPGGRAIVDTSLLLWLFQEARRHAERLGNIHIVRPASLGSGKTATFAQIYFDKGASDGGDSYMAKKPDGTIDLGGTVVRLKKAKKLVRAMCGDGYGLL